MKSKSLSYLWIGEYSCEYVKDRLIKDLSLLECVLKRCLQIEPILLAFSFSISRFCSNPCNSCLYHMSNSGCLLKKVCSCLLRMLKWLSSSDEWMSWGYSILAIWLMVYCWIAICCERLAICSSMLVLLASAAFSYYFLRCNCRLLLIFCASNWEDATFNFCFRTSYCLEL